MSFLSERDQVLHTARNKFYLLIYLLTLRSGICRHKSVCRLSSSSVTFVHPIHLESYSFHSKVAKYLNVTDLISYLSYLLFDNSRCYKS